MNWEERKRERKPPAPSSDYKPPTHEAAPYYTEDLIFQDTPDTNFQPSDFHSRKPEDHQVSETRQDQKFLQDLKEKTAFLESQLHSTKLKLSHFEKDNEKLQEELSQALSNRKNFILEQELASVKSQLDIKNKQTESLEKALKVERAKYSQELQEFKTQMKNLKENLCFEPKVVDEGDGFKVTELKEENRALKVKVLDLEIEKEKIIEKYERDLSEQYNYFQELLEEKNEKIEVEERVDDEKSKKEIEDVQEKIELEEIEVKSESHSPKEEPNQISEFFMDPPEETPQFSFEPVISDFFTAEDRGVEQFFESENPEPFETRSDFFPVFDQNKEDSKKVYSPKGKPYQFFEMIAEENAGVAIKSDSEEHKDENVESLDGPWPADPHFSSFPSNPNDFFSTLQPVSNYQTIPSSLFDS